MKKIIALFTFIILAGGFIFLGTKTPQISQEEITKSIETSRFIDK